jgi:hypothetical protein
MVVVCSWCSVCIVNTDTFGKGRGLGFTPGSIMLTRRRGFDGVIENSPPTSVLDMIEFSKILEWKDPLSFEKVVDVLRELSEF